MSGPCKPGGPGLLVLAASLAVAGCMPLPAPMAEATAKVAPAQEGEPIFLFRAPAGAEAGAILLRLPATRDRAVQRAFKASDVTSVRCRFTPRPAATPAGSGKAPQVAQEFEASITPEKDGGRALRFGNVPVGDYVLEVWARDARGAVLNREGKSAATPPFSVAAGQVTRLAVDLDLGEEPSGSGSVEASLRFREATPAPGTVLRGGGPDPTAPAKGSTARIKVDAGKSLGEWSPLLFGTSGSPYLDEAAFPKVKDAGFKLLNISAPLLAGTGVTDPDDPTQYDFSMLDAQIDALAKTGAEPMLTFAPTSKPSSLEKYGKFATHVIKHLTQGWGGGGRRSQVRLVRFGNEPESPEFWKGTRDEFFSTYTAWAKALKELDPALILDTPGVAGARASNDPDKVNAFLAAFLAHCKRSATPVDIVSFHAYENMPYPYHENARIVREEVAKYPGLSPLYGTPRIGNDEWNMMLGDAWSGGRYHKEFDTAWSGALSVTAVFNMADQGVVLSVPMNGVFNGGKGGCHDFPVVDCQGKAKPAYFAFKALNALAGTERIAATGGDRMSLAAAAGRSSSEVVVVLGYFNPRDYLRAFDVPSDAPDWRRLADMEAKVGTGRYESVELEVGNLPWGAEEQVTVDRYVVDASSSLALVATQTRPASRVALATSLAGPAVHLVRIHR